MVEKNNVYWNKISKMQPEEFNKQIKLARAGRPCLFYIPDNKNKTQNQGRTAISHFGLASPNTHSSRGVQSLHTTVEAVSVGSDRPRTPLTAPMQHLSPADTSRAANHWRRDRSERVARLAMRKVALLLQSRENMMGPHTNSHARARMRRAQSPSFPRLLDASSRMRKAVGCVHANMLLADGANLIHAAVLMVRAGTRAQ